VEYSKQLVLVSGQLGCSAGSPLLRAIGSREGSNTRQLKGQIALASIIIILTYLKKKKHGKGAYNRSLSLTKI
jgi:hypothetical protein